MSTSPTWKLKRVGRFVTNPTQEGTVEWKVVTADDSEPEIILTIVESGHVVISQGHECLDGIALLGASSFLKVQQRSDNLTFRYIVKGESRIMQIQFSGSSMAEAIKECSSAVAKLMEYVPVTTQDDTTPPTNPPPTEISAPAMQTGQGGAAGVEPEVVQGSLSIQDIAQHILGVRRVPLPLLYHHGTLPEIDLGAFVRACLLDPSFPAFVEEVEGELKKLLPD